MFELTVLIPTYERPEALAVTLTSLSAQTHVPFKVVISDQSAEFTSIESGVIQAACRVLQAHGCQVTFYHRHPKGMAEQRQFLLSQTTTPYCLFLDDDIILEPFVLQQLLQAIKQYRCGFVGAAPIGLSFREDIRPHEQVVEFWEGDVTPEDITPGDSKWSRYQFHQAANVWHFQSQRNLTPEESVPYKVAWVGGCVLFDTAKLVSVGGFSFWQQMPKEHCGEDVLAQLKVMQKYGGCGLLPSGAFHQELPSTIPDREINLPEMYIATYRKEER